MRITSYYYLIDILKIIYVILVCNVNNKIFYNYFTFKFLLSVVCSFLFKKTKTKKETSLPLFSYGRVFFFFCKYYKCAFPFLMEENEEYNKETNVVQQINLKKKMAR